MKSIAIPQSPNASADMFGRDCADFEDLEALAAEIHAPHLAISDRMDERQLEAAALKLRKYCLSLAHTPADSTLKSPCEGTTARTPEGVRVSVEYERELDVSVLESRGSPDYATPEGWQSTRILCRSGQAALACLIHFVLSTRVPERGPAGVLRIHHAGRYFETGALLDLWPPQILPRFSSEAPDVDLLIGEPVHCDGAFGISVPATLPRVLHALLLDTTLSGPEVDLAPWFAHHHGTIAAAFRSGLKLDQAGLELANVGIVQLFVRSGTGINIDTLADELRHVRGLTGAGLTLDELSALSVPWFLNRGYFQRYTARIFAHNGALAQAIGNESPVFAARCHPSLVKKGVPAPFCAIRLRQGDLADHRRLLARVDDEVDSRGIVATKGGSFGFRGIRYELVEPKPEDGDPFLRVALGYRGGSSCSAMTELLAELANG
jgi:hypothetical protein